MNEATSLSSSMTRIRTLCHTIRSLCARAYGEPRPKAETRSLCSGAPREIAGLCTRHLIDAVDRVAEAVDLHRIEFRVHPAADLRDPDHMGPLQIVALELELHEIGIEW